MISSISVSRNIRRNFIGRSTSIFRKIQLEGVDFQGRYQSQSLWKSDVSHSGPPCIFSRRNGPPQVGNTEKSGNLCFPIQPTGELSLEDFSSSSHGPAVGHAMNSVTRSPESLLSKSKNEPPSACSSACYSASSLASFHQTTSQSLHQVLGEVLRKFPAKMRPTALAGSA